MHRLFYMLLLVYLPVFGQFIVTGKVVDQVGQPVIGAEVALKKAKTLTDAEGNFTFSKVTTGNFRLRLTNLGFTTFDTIIEVKRSLFIPVVLIERLQELDEVTISNTGRAGLKQLSTVPQENMQRQVSQSLADVLSGLPGINTLRTGSAISKPIVHGLHSSRVPIMINGLRLEDQSWGMEHAPTIAIGQAEKISVLNGPATLQYGGDAIGGLVLVEHLPIRNDSLFGHLVTSLHTNGLGGTLNMAITKSTSNGWAWKVKADNKYFGDRSAPNYNLANTGSREYSLSADLENKNLYWTYGGTVNYFKTNLGILSAAHIGNAADLYYSINNNQPQVMASFTYAIDNPKQEVRHLSGRFFARYEPSEKNSWTIQYQLQQNKRLEYDLRRGNNKNRPALDLTLTTNSLLLDGVFKQNDLKLSYGTLATYQQNFANPDTGIRPLIPNYNKFDAGLYWIAQQDISSSICLKAGVRYDFSYIAADKYYLKSRWDERGYSPAFDQFIVEDAITQWRVKPRFNYYNLSASLSLSYSPSKYWRMQVSASNYMRNPNPSELFSDGLHHATGMIELGSIALRQEKATKATVEINYCQDTWNISVVPFANQLSNFIYMYPLGFETTIRGVFPVWEFKQTNAILAGLDMQTEVQLFTNMQYNLIGSWLYAWDKTQRQYLIDMPPLTVRQNVSYTLANWHALKIELSHQFVGTQTNYPNANFTTNIVKNEIITPVLVDISTPPPGYQLWHFYSEITFKNKANSSFVVGLSVQNLTNKTYRNYLNRQRFFADEVGRNVMVQIQYNF